MAIPGIERLNKVRSRWINFGYIQLFGIERTKMDKELHHAAFKGKRKSKFAYRILDMAVLCANYDTVCTKYTAINHKWNLRASGCVRHTTLENEKKKEKRIGKRQNIKDQFLFFVQSSMCLCICCMWLDAMYALCELFFVLCCCLLAFSFVLNSVFFILCTFLLTSFLSTCLFAPTS